MKNEKTYGERSLPRRPSHPGALLADILPDMSQTATELANELRIPQKQFESILKEEAPVTAEIAQKLGSKFGDGADIWLRMQAAYDEWAESNAIVEEEIDSIGYPTISEPHRENVSYRCPCCKCLTLHERGGYEICPVCFWEDDGQDDPYADEMSGGSNGEMSLTQARSNYAEYGAMEERFVGCVRRPKDDELPC